MYLAKLHHQINQVLQHPDLDIARRDNTFYTRFLANGAAIYQLYQELYGRHPQAEAQFGRLLHTLVEAYRQRPESFRQRDLQKEAQNGWFLSNQIAGMSLYVDRFCGNLANLREKLDYFQELGVNLLHLMPLFESPEGESDGGYAVSDFRRVDPRFGHLDELRSLQQEMLSRGMYLMLDIVLNHTSHQHEWARKARAGELHYQDYYYFFPDRSLPDQFEQTMPEIFPESAPGNFTFIPETGKWVMTVFHNYQWDLNFRNPEVLVVMLDTIFFYANLGVDLLRIDAPAFIWKQLGTTCQNLPEAHTILRLIRLCVEVASPGMALLGEAIVAPREIMNYFGAGAFTARECDFAYNATHMALQWDMLATGDTRVMLAAQAELLRKPLGASWITYTRCHDDIGLGYEDAMIQSAGYDPFAHRYFLRNYYSGNYKGSPATGALFSFNPKTQDARISGSLASLCGLEKALRENDEPEIERSVCRILLMQAHSFFLGGIPMLFYGDELGYTNDYSYLLDPGKSYDNRWMHRPVIDWKKNERRHQPGSIEHRIFRDTRRLLELRRQLPAVADHKNLLWLQTQYIQVAGYLRQDESQPLYAFFNFSPEETPVYWGAIRQTSPMLPAGLFDYWSGQGFSTENGEGRLVLAPFGFVLLGPLTT